MNETEIIEMCREAIMVMLRISGPILLVGLVVGVVVSLFQAVTQIQEVTLTFVPKMLAIFVVTILLLPFMLSTLKGFTQLLADKIVQIGQNGS